MTRTDLQRARAIALFEAAGSLVDAGSDRTFPLEEDAAWPGNGSVQ